MCWISLPPFSADTYSKVEMDSTLQPIQPAVLPEGRSLEFGLNALREKTKPVYGYSCTLPESISIVPWSRTLSTAQRANRLRKEVHLPPVKKFQLQCIPSGYCCKTEFTSQLGSFKEELKILNIINAPCGCL